MRRRKPRELVTMPREAPVEGAQGEADELGGAGAVAVAGDEGGGDGGVHGGDGCTRGAACGTTGATPWSMMTAMHIVLGTEGYTRSLSYPSNRKQLGGKVAAKVAADNAAMGIRTEFGYLPKGWEVCGEFTYPRGVLKARLIKMTEAS